MGRGLKRFTMIGQGGSGFESPRMGRGLKLTIRYAVVVNGYRVAPYGAWIETSSRSFAFSCINESPRMGRGLKLTNIHFLIRTYPSRPVWGVD